MATKIILKHSSGATSPTLDYGELAIKYLNGSEALYTKNSNNEIVAFNTWTKILGKPTTLSGYGITDAVVKDGDVIMNTNPFGGRPLYINSIDNAMFAASKKWYVTVTTHARTYNSESYPKLNPIWVESYSVTGSGTAFNVSGSPTSIVVYNSDTLCSEVTTPTTQNQYKYAGGVLTFGATVTGTIRVYPGYDVKQYIDSPVTSTLDGNSLFDGSYETTIGVSAGYYMKINIKFNENGTAGFGGYPYGSYFLSYYYTETPEKAEYRVYNRTYRPHIIGWKKYDFTDFKNDNTSSSYIQSCNDGGNYGRSEIEFIVYGHPTHSTQPTQIDLKLDRPNLSVNGSTVTKYGVNKLYYDLQFGNQTSNNLTLYTNGNIDTNGTVSASSFVGNASSATKLANARTIWGQSFDGSTPVSGAMTTVTSITMNGALSGATTGNFSSTLNVSGNTTLKGLTITNGTKSITLTVDVDGNLKLDNATSGASFYATGEVSAYGAGSGSTGGGTSYNRLDLWADYGVDKAGYVLSAYLGYDLNSRLSAIEGNGATTITTTGAGNAITSVSKTGTAITFNKNLNFSEVGHTHNYLNLSGGTMTGALNFKNSTWNNVGDDVAIGDIDVAGQIGIKALNTVNPGIAFYNNSSAAVGNLVSNAGILQWSDNKIWHAGNFTPSSYLPLSGGTMTGILTVRPSNISGIQDGIILDDSGGGLGECLKITWKSASYTTGKSLYASPYGDLVYDGNTVWHAGNDGSSSGLDADLLDGLNSSSTNVASTIVARDASGDFAAGSIIAEESFNYSTNAYTVYNTTTKSIDFVFN